ncbi:hypothetical protein [Sinomonas sp. R1AF57]|uniref:hypothetical protein n=1 Tax=Sinomonas sp. R1AF57 TaxID=2020377 RepID=UPI000B6086B9|nr:hypothetical protein [Sinomonas sp. R1AF57]ASN53401.1 hypothetical protein CGQ25_15930 [Sinomonas sp. R1AF57]
MHTPEGTARPRRLPEPSRIEETAAAMAAVGEATDEDLAAWTPEKLGSADQLLADLERTATAWDTEPRAEIGDKLWRTNHRFLTDSRALRARLRPHLTATADEA